MWVEHGQRKGGARAWTVMVALAMLVAACAGPAATSSVVAPSASPSSASAVPSPSVTQSAPATPGASATPDSAVPTFPPSQTTIEPGTYRWDGFERTIKVTVGAGWEIGHDNLRFFDLFRGSDFPGVSFARFTDVYKDAETPAGATDADTVAAILGARPDITMTKPTAITLGGLPGVEFDLTTTAPKTPVFFGPAGDFRLEPEFKTRYRVLDFPCGVLVIGIHSPGDGFDAAIALADPVVMSLDVAPTNP